MPKVLVVAGTADARQVIEELLKMNIEVVATVTTRLGGDLLKPLGNVDVREGRITLRWLAGLLSETKPLCLVDASHPFAREASQNAVDACKRRNVPYIRFEREETVYTGTDIVKVKDYEQAVQKLCFLEGNILLTVGSGKMEAFVKIPDYRNRVYLRVLPESNVIARCEKLGFNAKNIIAMKGPFTEELNIALLKYCNASAMVTKESGNAGGVMEKINAARKLGIPVIMIERPEVVHGHKANAIDAVLEFVKNCRDARMQEGTAGNMDTTFR
ncbi:MAG: precorrin-6A reductase [Clostridiales bacterium]|nr:precorrin-6A reductase [Eubacteriales bacterium]MDH7566244.1 precorrin-6A reductase [Clostridiales bacterium]